MQPKVQKLVIATSIIGAIAIVAVAIVRSRRKKLQAKIKSGSPDVMVPAKQTVTSVLFPLKKGSGVNIPERDAVKVVQRYINVKALHQYWLQVTLLKEDGIFGPLTESSLMKLAGVKEVSYSFYKEMQAVLIPNESYAGLLDPNIQKNVLYNKL